MPLFAQLVENRECGACNYCCQHLAIDTAEIRLSPGTLCTNWVDGKGCGIYETRPTVCRGYFCGWRMLKDFDESWRPDLSGMIVTMVKDIQLPWLSEGLEFVMVRPEIASIKPDFITFIVAAIDERIPVFLSLCGPPGHSPARVFLNSALEQAVHDRNQADFLAIYKTLLERLRTSEFKPVVFKHKLWSSLTLPADLDKE